MALSYNLGYQESISVHPTRRQIFAGKPYSTFPNIWEWLIYQCLLCKIAIIILGCAATMQILHFEMSLYNSSEYSNVCYVKFWVVLQQCKFFILHFVEANVVIGSQHMQQMVSFLQNTFMKWSPYCHIPFCWKLYRECLEFCIFQSCRPGGQKYKCTNKSLSGSACAQTNNNALKNPFKTRF